MKRLRELGNKSVEQPIFSILSKRTLESPVKLNFVTQAHFNEAKVSFWGLGCGGGLVKEKKAWAPFHYLEQNRMRFSAFNNITPPIATPVGLPQVLCILALYLYTWIFSVLIAISSNFLLIFQKPAQKTTSLGYLYLPRKIWHDNILGLFIVRLILWDEIYQEKCFCEWPVRFVSFSLNRTLIFGHFTRCVNAVHIYLKK